MTLSYIDTIDNFMHDSEFVAWLHLAKPPSLEVAWATCPLGDEMLWLVHACLKHGGDGVDRSTLIACACDIAELALPLVPAGEDRPRLAIETARLRLRGQATADEATAAGARAGDACHEALLVGRDSARACLAAASAAYSAAVSRREDTCAWAADTAGLVEGTRSETIAAIVRKHLPNPPDIRVLEMTAARW